MHTSVRDLRRSWRTTRQLVAATALLATVALAGCGSDQPTGPPTSATTGPAAPTTPTRTPGGSLSASPLPPASPGATGTARADQTLTGRVQEGVESGCLVLVDDSGTVLANLIGFDPTGVDVSGVIEVTGSFNPDLMTICQQGRPFEVISVRAG